MKRKWWYSNPQYKNSKKITLVEFLYKIFIYFATIPALIFLLAELTSNNGFDLFGIVFLGIYLFIFVLIRFLIKKKIWKVEIESNGKLRW